MFLFLLFATCVTAYLDDVVDYHNYTVVSTVATTDSQLSLLQRLYLNDVSYRADFWNEPTVIGERVIFGMPKSEVENVARLLATVGAPLVDESVDLQKSIDDERDSNPAQFSRGVDSRSFALNQYHRYPEIEAYLRQVVLENPKFVKRSIIGHTEQNREIIALKIGTSGTDKPVIMLDAGIHAREWVAPATALYIINQLVTNYGTDKLITRLVDSYDWYVIPVVNPDGYAYTWSMNRNWRKNRSRPAPFSGCYGVDPNRNFALGFAGASTSKNPCSDLYPGPSAFSEAEARAVKSLTEKNVKRIRAVFTLHSFGQMWMNPWGYMNKKPDDYEAMLSAAKKAVAALQSVHGTPYKTGAIYEVIYPTGGGSVDWQYSITNASYSYAIELRPTQRSPIGFQLPNSQIIPVGEETWKGISTLVGDIK